VAIAATSPKPAIDKGLKAGDWVKAAAQACGGAGGGRPDTAQAGGKDTSKAREALEAAKALAQRKIFGFACLRLTPNCGNGRSLK
jgi:alanyl-tRNA synthetase